MPRVSRQAVLIGNTGFLGRAMELQVRASGDPSTDVVVPDHRALISALLQPSGTRGAVVSPLLRPDGDQDWIFAAGLVDPRADPADLDRINVEAPLRLVEHLSDHVGPGRRRLITFGSVLERRPELAGSNAYLSSKARLFGRWKQMHAELPLTWIHVHLHTLYGGSQPPHPFMFTGQMLAALTNGSRFQMSGGEQLREYHHLDDIAQSIVRFLQSVSPKPRLLELSCGRPVRLRDLAQAVFEHFRALELLSIGARPACNAEIYENEYAYTPDLAAYREPCAGVIAWFEGLGVKPK
jgi:nucleoside-diphosphate-sugar epimerase